jgi:ankyrin repeat protein
MRSGKTRFARGRREAPIAAASFLTLLNSRAMLRAPILLIGFIVAAFVVAYPVGAQSLRELLFDAIKAGDYAETARLIKAGIHYTARNERGETALIAASEYARADMVTLLLENGADAAAKSSNGETALHAAALHADAEIARLLLQNGAQADPLNRDGESPLFWAALSGSVDVVKLLVERGAQITRADAKGNSILHAAAADGHLSVIAYLLERKANRSVRNKAGERPVDLAKLRGQDAAVELLSRR